ncbi:hypothetical protein [Fischerella sp. PCC 9605]|uniref:hypothetical protein n=1 Tax=Fischerella sp. PCC 9605 TaxID=1173024 RepID=UPI00047EBC90|nr:hypothetical protein [Fischerella sp. PCC 9605]
MKNKFLALAAFGAALGSTIVSAPANAQINQGSGPSSPITVNVSVPEVLYLRTITDTDIEITAADLTAATLTAVPGTTPPAYIGSDKNEEADGTVNSTSPFAGGFADGLPVQKTITSAYVVWSNSPSGSYQVQVTPPAGGLIGPGGKTINVAVVGANPATRPAEGLITATPGDIGLELSPSDSNPTAGTYTGDVTVEAFRP